MSSAGLVRQVRKPEVNHKHPRLAPSRLARNSALPPPVQGGVPPPPIPTPSSGLHHVVLPAANGSSWWGCVCLGWKQKGQLRHRLFIGSPGRLLPLGTGRRQTMGRGHLVSTSLDLSFGPFVADEVRKVVASLARATRVLKQTTSWPPAPYGRNRKAFYVTAPVVAPSPRGPPPRCSTPRAPWWGLAQLVSGWRALERPKSTSAVCSPRREWWAPRHELDCVHRLPISRSSNELLPGNPGMVRRGRTLGKTPSVSGVGRHRPVELSWAFAVGQLPAHATCFSFARGQSRRGKLLVMDRLAAGWRHRLSAIISIPHRHMRLS
jgi:hypothetical protein